MVWKKLAQTDLSDALIQHHEALEELDDINVLIDWRLIEEKLSVIAKNYGNRALAEWWFLVLGRVGVREICQS